MTKRKRGDKNNEEAINGTNPILTDIAYSEQQWLRQGRNNRHPHAASSVRSAAPADGDSPADATDVTALTKTGSSLIPDTTTRTIAVS